MSEKLNISGEGKIILDLLKELNNVDLKKTATHKNLPLEANGEVVIESFSRCYLVSQDGVSVTDGRSISSKQKVAVLSYILSESTGAPAYDFVPFSHLGGFNIGREQHVGKSIKQPLLNTFGDEYELFAKAALKIGGIQTDGDTPDKHVWLFKAFPNIPIQVIFYGRDEEFPADVQVLFDNKALDYFGTKCLGLLPGYFTCTLIDAASDL
ncbi:MAG: hypothetical protein ACI8ZB_004516 [Desulforhopalus sp.]|jgi:hypothetical protein